ncbi:hypothetical protein FACS189485_21970 [Spirochaetia bacterium]|nr:hypothetical protein FACS189485_21970 [Spirochaetia bacterium]
MNSMIETGIIAGIVALAAVFVALRIVRTLRSKRPDCCAGKGRAFKKTGAPCPYCAAAENQPTC